MRRNKSNHSIRPYYELLYRYLLPQRGTLIALAVLLFASIGMQLINPQIIRYFIDTAGAQGALQPLVIAAGMFIGFSLIQSGGTLLDTRHDVPQIPYIRLAD